MHVSEFDNVIGDITSAAESQNETIVRLNEEMTQQHFDQADQDGDGKVTQEEWTDNITGR